MLELIHPRAAVVDRDGTVHDAASVRTMAGAAADRLGEAGVGSGDIVAVAARDDARFLGDLFGVWMRGAAAACLDPELPPPEAERALAFLAPKAFLAGGAMLRPDAAPRSRADIVGPALVLMTSGTTGAPKGVVIGAEALQARLRLNIAAIGVEPLRRALVTLPLHFGHGLIGNALTPLAAGGAVFLAERGLGLAAGLGARIDRDRVTFLASVPSFWRIALKTSAPPEGGTLRRVHVGSAPLDAALWARIAAWTGCEVVNCYGMSETANWFSGAAQADGVADGHVGRPWGGEAAILKPDGTIAPDGEGEREGEIVVRTPALMASYLDRPDLTDAAMLAGWFRTGDTGHMDASGAITLSGRIKEEINRGGVKVQPAEIDRVLAAHPDVAEACAFGVPDAASGEAVAVAVRMTEGCTFDREALRAWCVERLRRDAVPERFFAVDALPLSARGKVSREAARRMALGGAA